MTPIELEASEELVLADEWGNMPEMISGPGADDILAEGIKDFAEYGLDPPKTKIRLGLAEGADVEFYLGNTTPDGDHRYASLLGGDQLFSMPIARAQRISALITDPPVRPEDKPKPGSG